MKHNKEPIAWITVKKRRVPIFAGESKADAVKRQFGNPVATSSKAAPPAFKTRQECYDYYEKKFSECSSTYRNKVATQLGISGRGKEKIKALANSYADKWQKSSQINADNDTKEKQIKNNEEQAANAANAEKLKLSYSRFRDAAVMTYEFKKNTGITVSYDVMTRVPKSKLAEIYDTVEDIKNQYPTNITKIGMVLDDDASRKAWDMEADTIADMNSDGRLRLNERYFKDPQLMMDMQKENAAHKYNQWHPITPPDAYYKCHVVHELGHSILFKQVAEYADEQAKNDFGNAGQWMTYYNEMLTFLNHKEWLTKPMYIGNGISRGNTLYVKFMNALDGIVDKYNNDPQIRQEWGGKPGLSIFGWADPHFGHKWSISQYAAKSYHELVAEAFCDVYCNGYDNARPLSKDVYTTIIKGGWLK